MEKIINVQRTLLLSITLTGDVTRDLIALGGYPFEIPVLFAQTRDMITMPHEPVIFYRGPKGVYSHSLGEDNVLSIWKELITVKNK